MKTSELTATALDWAVAKSEGWHIADDYWISDPNEPGTGQPLSDFNPSSDWAQGGPIIEREIAKIERFSDSLWEATAFTKNAQDFVQDGPTPLIAALRCYVCSKLGYDVDVPKELT